MTDIDTHVEGLIKRICENSGEAYCDFSGFWRLASELEAARKVVAECEAAIDAGVWLPGSVEVALAGYRVMEEQR